MSLWLLLQRSALTLSIMPLSLISILKCLWFCCVVENVCQQGQTLAHELQTEPSWESWLCSPRMRSSAVSHSPRKRGPAPGSARSRSTSTTRHRSWTESTGKEGREKRGGRWVSISSVYGTVCGNLQACERKHLSWHLFWMFFSIKNKPRRNHKATKWKDTTSDSILHLAFDTTNNHFRTNSPNYAFH